MELHEKGLQMEAPRSGTYLPAGYAPQYPPAAVQGPPEHTGRPTFQTNYQVPQSGYPGPQASYTVSTSGHEGYAATRLPIQNNQTIVLANTQWMPAPPPILNCPPGLEYLNQVSLYSELTKEIKSVFLLRIYLNNK